MNFANDTHALRTGFLLGALMKAGIPATPVTDAEGNYTDEIDVVLEVGDYEIETSVTIKVLPPT